MPSLNIVGRYNNAGVEKDMKILGTALEQLGHQVTYSEAGRKPLYFRLHKKQLFDANIFVEKPEPLFFPAAAKNFLKPNQEVMANLAGLDALFVKTRYAHDIYQKQGMKTHYIGFTSEDRYLPHVVKEPFFFHMTSRSTLKGTAQIIEAWKRFSHMPPLVILVAPLFRSLIEEIPGVTWIDTFLPDEELRLLQNRALYHLCPSSTEGFGHSLVEALSTKALVITTDAPPMNELVSPERGVLCAWTNKLPAGFGAAYYVSPEQIGEAVFRALALPDKERYSAAARAFFEETQAAFPRALEEALGAFPFF